MNVGMQRQGGVITLAVLLLSGVAASAASIGLFSVADTSLIESFPTNNLGAQGYFTSGAIQNVNCVITNNGTNIVPIPCRNRGLFRFDIAGSIPPGSRIKSAVPRIWMQFASQDEEANPSGFDIHRVLVPWTQGSGSNVVEGAPPPFPGTLGQPAQAGEPCWAYRQTPSIPWAEPGGAAGIDYQEQASGTAPFINNRNNQDYFFQAVSNRIVQDVQLWLDQPGTNFGWLMKASDEFTIWTAKRFLTPESGLDNYPRLEIEYIPPPVIQQLQAMSNQLKFFFEADAEQVYEVQYRDSLTSGAWLVLTNVPSFAEATNIWVCDSLPPGLTNRYYRIVAP
jgi:hypothetical protein